MNEQLRAKINMAIGKLCRGCLHYSVDCKEEDGVSFRCRDCGAVLPKYPSTPDYCQDRNTLPEVWEVIAKLEKDFDFYAEAFDISGVKHIPIDSARHLAFMTMLPVYQCIAALRATGNWTPEMGTLWQEEQFDGTEGNCCQDFASCQAPCVYKRQEE